MALCDLMELEETTEPITELVTKFGGRPVWLTEPQWPLSASTQKPMNFIAQIVLDAELFPESTAEVAYLF